MNKKKLYVVISLVLVTILILLTILLCINVKLRNVNLPTLADVTSTSLSTIAPHIDTSYLMDIKDDNKVDATPTIMPAVILQPTTPPRNSAMAIITIVIDKKTRTYDIMDNVDVETLKKNIGHLPSSALPGEVGLCILMGHRDTDFSILQYVEIGDKLTIAMNGIPYEYTVSEIQIVNSDRELRFGATKDATLVLVTCYPFRYTGHAPNKYVITAIR